jgi:hypothetical protein
MDSILGALADRAYAVRLWRKVDGARNEWVYLGESPPAVCYMVQIGKRYGGGWYRARLYGRQGGYITRVEFGLDERTWPVTQATGDLIRRHQEQ